MPFWRSSLYIGGALASDIPVLSLIIFSGTQQVLVKTILIKSPLSFVAVDN